MMDSNQSKTLETYEFVALLELRYERTNDRDLSSNMRKYKNFDTKKIGILVKFKGMLMNV